MPRRRRSWRLVLAVLLIVGLSSAVFAQRIWVGGPRGGFGGRFAPPKVATAADFDGSFIYCRGFYRSRYGEPGGSGNHIL